MLQQLRFLIETRQFSLVLKYFSAAELLLVYPQLSAKDRKFCLQFLLPALLPPLNLSVGSRLRLVGKFSQTKTFLRQLLKSQNSFVVTENDDCTHILLGDFTETAEITLFLAKKYSIFTEKMLQHAYHTQIFWQVSEKESQQLVTQFAQYFLANDATSQQIAWTQSINLLANPQLRAIAVSVFLCEKNAENWQKLLNALPPHLQLPYVAILRANISPEILMQQLNEIDAEISLENLSLALQKWAKTTALKNLSEKLLWQYGDENALCTYLTQRTTNGFVQSAHAKAAEVVHLCKKIKYLVIPSQNLPDESWANFAHLQGLEISDLLTEIPPQAARLQNLRRFSVFHQLLPTLPESMQFWQKIEVLVLENLFPRNGFIAEIPEWLADFENLTYLSLKNNNVSLFPKIIARLPSLKHLHLGGNALTNLPEFNENWTSLETLFLDDNPLEKLPKSIAFLSKLKLLRLSESQLQKESFADSLQQLQENLSSNCRVLIV